MEYDLIDDRAKGNVDDDSEIMRWKDGCMYELFSCVFQYVGSNRRQMLHTFGQFGLI